jgi:hypothetical protein
MIQITPTFAGFPQEIGTQLLIRSIPFELGSKSSQVYWELLTEDNKQLASGNIIIPEEIHEIWLDDSVIENYVLEQLKLTLNK